jgi:hypothetical protein
MTVLCEMNDEEISHFSRVLDYPGNVRAKTFAMKEQMAR